MYAKGVLLVFGLHNYHASCCTHAWFVMLYLQSTQRVLATFTAWDVDGNGTLSKSEFSAISQVGVLASSIDRVCPALCSHNSMCRTSGSGM